MPNIRGPELLILVLVIVILFGAKRLPDAARSVGRSLRIFKSETKGLTDAEAADAGGQADTNGAQTQGPQITDGTTDVRDGAGEGASPGGTPASEPTSPRAQQQPPQQA